MSQDYVALLGTKGGPAIRPGSSMPTSALYVLNGHQIVVDCGLGVTKGLVDQGMQLKDLSLIFITHLHSDHYLVALSFKTTNVHVVFTGDTAPIDTLEDFARGADLLIHEAMLEAALPALLKRVGNGSDKLMDHWLRSHTFAHDAAMLATAAGVKQLALSHLVPADDPDFGTEDWHAAVADHWDGPLVVGHDGVRIPL